MVAKYSGVTLTDPISGLTSAGGGGAPSTLKSISAARAAQRQHRGRGHCRDARQRPQRALRTAPRDTDLLRLRVRRPPCNVDAERQRLFGHEPRDDAGELHEAADQQAGAGQQHDGERHLGDDEPGADAMRAAAGAAARPPSRSARVQSPPVACSAGRMPKPTPVTSETASVKSTTVPFKPTSSSRGMSAGRAATSARVPQYAIARPDSAAASAEHDRLGQQLPQQPAAARAERGADRQSPVACRGPREQQVRDVRAGDEQHEPTAPRSMSSGVSTSPTISSRSEVVVNVSCRWSPERPSAAARPSRRRSSSICVARHPALARPMHRENSERRPVAVAALKVSPYSSGAYMSGRVRQPRARRQHSDDACRDRRRSRPSGRARAVTAERALPEAVIEHRDAPRRAGAPRARNRGRARPAARGGRRGRR